MFPSPVGGGRYRRYVSGESYLDDDGRHLCRKLVPQTEYQAFVGNIYFRGSIDDCVDAGLQDSDSTARDGT